MASIYDFAPASLDSVKDTDFSTNYGFNVVTYTVGMPQKENFIRGIEAYANMEKDAEMRDFAHSTFGKNLPSKEHAPFWVGQAYINQLGYKSIADAYIDLNIPIPENAKDFDTLTTTLGRNILDNFSKDYDTRKSIAADVAKRAQANFDKLYNGTYTVADLKPEHYQEIADYTGYAPQDIYIAGQISRNNEGKGLAELVGEPTKAFLYSAATIPSRIGESAAAAFKLDFEQAAERLFRSSSGFEKNIDQKIQGTAHAYDNALVKDQAFLKMASNPKHVLDIISQQVYKKEKESLDDSYMLGRMLTKLSDVGGEIYQGLGDTVTYATAPFVTMAGGESTDTMLGQQASAAVSDAKNAAAADVAKSRGSFFGGIEMGANLLMDTAAIANPYTAIPSVTSIFTNNAGRGLNALTKNDGELYDTFSPLELYGKSAFSAATTYLSRNVATRYMPKLANRALTGMGVNSTVGHYLGTAAWGTFGFAVTLPAMESVANFAYDEFFVTHPDLKTGVQQAQQFVNDIQTPEHWLMSAVAGGVTGAKGTLDYYRSGIVLAEIHQTQGVSKEEADLIRRHTPLEDQPIAYRDLIQAKIKDTPQKWADDLIDGAQKFQEQEQQRIVEKNGYNAMVDDAKLATLKLKGFTLAAGKDSDHITIITGGHQDPVTGKYIEGTGKIELTKDRAAYFLGAMFDANASIVTDILRNTYAKDVLQDAILNDNSLMGKVTISASLDPFVFNQVISRGKQAESLIEKRAKEIVESSKAEDGKPSISESDARTQASAEVHPELHTSHTLAELVSYGKDADTRVQQETERNRNLDPDTTFVSHAWTITPNPNLPRESLVRIVKITQQASAANLTEEYSEMWLDDYMFLNNVDITDAWRILDAVNQYIKDSDATTTTLRSDLATRLRNKEISDDFSLNELELIHKDVKEGFSFATLSTLRNLANSGQLPDWVAPVYNSSFLMQHRAQQELAAAAAISVAQNIGEYDASLKRLLGVTANQVQSILQEAPTPTVDSYIQTYYKTKSTYDALLDGDGKTADQVEEILAQQAQAQEETAALTKAQQEEESAEFEQLIDEASALPQNADKTRDQIALELNQETIKAKETEIAESPAAIDDSSSTSGKAVESADPKSKLPCRKATVNIADLHLMPNFKSGSDEDTGVVYALVGTYRADHDPIRVMQRTDGSLMVFSGRHRLDHAKKAGMEVIEAYIYQETAEHNLAWAQLKDIEWNIQDNQASAEDIALLIRGELIDGIPALTAEQMIQIGIVDRTSGKPRPKTNAETGYYIGINAISDVVTALKMGDIDTTQAYALALHSPNNEQLQRVGLRAMQDNKSTRLALHEMDVERDRLAYLEANKVAVQMDLFGNLEMDETYSNFISEYSFNKLKNLASLDKTRKLANRTAKDPNARKAMEGTGLMLDASAHKRNAKSLKNKQRSIAEQIYIWQHPWTNMDIIGDEINTAFAQAHPEEWQRMQERLNPPTEDSTPDLGNTVQGDVSNVKEFDFSISSYDTLQAWQLDPTAGLGSLGHFTANIEQKLAPVGVDFVDQKYAAIQNFIKRRMAEIRNMHDVKDINTLLAELDMLPDIVQSLPAGYRFGLEPYIQFLTTYANLIKHADPKKAPATLPMAKWDKRMEGSFRKAFERLLFDELSDMEQSEFDALFDSEKAAADMAQFREEALQARAEAREHFLQTHNVSLAEIQLNEDLSRNYERAQRKAVQEVTLKHQDTVDTMYRAIGQMRATRLVDKLLARVNLKIEQFRKDRTLQKIARALASITPRTQKDGKPVRGSVEKRIYDTAVDNYRLLLLTKSQKEAADEIISNLETKAEENGKELADDTKVDIPTYDENGAPITLTVTLKQYETYASLESMSADHAAATSQTLGTFIANGKEAWQLRAEQETKAVADFCSPIYEKYQEDEKQQHLRERAEETNIGGDKGIRHAITQALNGTLNDASLIDVIASFPGMEQFRKVQDQIANAHEYIEACEYMNAQNAITAALNACGFKDVDPLKMTSKQRKAFAKFMEDINTPKQVSITLTPQAPDFQARITAELRNSLLKHLNFLTTKKKNFSPNEFAAVLQDLKQQNTLPSELLKEVFDKYGKIGNASLFKGKLENAYNHIFPAQKFGQLRNINKTIETRTQDNLAQWQKDNNTKPVTLTDLTRNEAAYRVLTAEQSDYTDLMRRQGYTPQVLQQLRDFAGEDMMNFAYSLRTLLNARTDTLKQIYESTYGTPFPVVENYFRAFFNASSKETNNSRLEDLSHGAEGKGAGGIKLFKTRIKHNARIRSTMTVTEAFRIGMKEQDNLIAYADSNNHRHIGEFLSRVLSNQQGQTLMRDVLNNAIGSDFQDALSQQVKNMYRIYGHAEGFDSTANRFIRDLSAGAATVILIGRAVSVGKNVMAFFNTLGGADNISPWQWYKSAIRVMTGRAIKKGSDLINETLIKTRFKEWDTESYVESLYLKAGVKSTLNAATIAAKRGMSIFGAFDRWCTSKSAAVLYDAVYRQLQKENPSLTAEYLHTECMMSIGRALGLKGQPLNFKQRPLVSTKNSWRTAAFYFLGGEAWSTFMDCSRLFIKSITTKDVTPAQRHRALANLAAVWLTNGAMYGLLNYFFNFLLDDEEHWRKRSFLGTVGINTLIGPASGMPIISNILAETSEQFGRRVLGWDMPYISTPSYLPMSNIFQQIGNLKKVISRKSSAWDKAIAANDALRAVLLITLASTQRPTTKTGVAIKTGSLVGAALSNALDFIFKLSRAADERL